MNTLQVLKHGIGLCINGYYQQSFISTYLKPIVDAHAKRIGYTLTPSEKKKVLFYYPMYAILACAEMYTSLRGRGLTIDERKRLTLLAAWATLCDDLVDDHNWSRDEIFRILFEEVNEKTYPGNVQLLIALNKELNKVWKVSEKYINQLKVALEWQSVSSRQLDPNITPEEIIEICRQKNGNTSLMFATLLDETWTEKESEVIYQSAIVGQLTNDAFDIYFDTQKGIRTYFNTAPSIAEVREFFIEECRKLHLLVRQCKISKQNQERTIRRMTILDAFTLTAIDQLTTAEARHKKPIDWKGIPRKELIIDMAKNSNRWKTVKYMKWLAEV